MTDLKYCEYLYIRWKHGLFSNSTGSNRFNCIRRQPESKYSDDKLYHRPSQRPPNKKIYGNDNNDDAF